MCFVGVDMGSSSTKLVLKEDANFIDFLCIDATNSKEKLEQHIESMLVKNSIKKEKLKKVFLTGINSLNINGNLLDTETVKVSEFEAVGRGALYLSNLSEAIVLSLGTGTAYIYAKDDKFLHLGGLSLGGGTVMGLGKALLDAQSFSQISMLSQKGRIENVDLLIKDVIDGTVSNLWPDTSVSFFGGLKEDASKEDMALGIFNLVIQSVSMSAVFTARQKNTKNIVVLGSLTNYIRFDEILNSIKKLCDNKFIIPKNAAFAGAIGAVMKS